MLVVVVMVVVMIVVRGVRGMIGGGVVGGHGGMLRQAITVPMSVVQVRKVGLRVAQWPVRVRVSMGLHVVSAVIVRLIM